MSACFNIYHIDVCRADVDLKLSNCVVACRLHTLYCKNKSTDLHMSFYIAFCIQTNFE